MKFRTHRQTNRTATPPSLEFRPAIAGRARKQFNWQIAGLEKLRGTTKLYNRTRDDIKRTVLSVIRKRSFLTLSPA
jgi:hypothetical protein